MNAFTSVTCDDCGATLRAPCAHPEMLAPLAVSSSWILAYPYGDNIAKTFDLCPRCNVARDARPHRNELVVSSDVSQLEASLAPKGTLFCCFCLRFIPEGFMFDCGDGEHVCIDCQRDLDDANVFSQAETFHVS